MSLTADELADIALQAGALIMEIYATDFDVDRKDDSSPVTEADAKAETLILQRLAAVDPELPVIAEESMSEGKVPEHGHRFALVDPLDGTKEFINKRGEFTVNIAIIEYGRPVMGVVYAPALSRLFVADSVDMAWQADVAPGGDVPGASDRRPLTIRRCPEAGLTAIASKSHRSPETDAFLEKFNTADIISAGSSLKFCLIAAGEADFYPRMGRTMEWDTAAGHAVLLGAGGQVVRFDDHTPLAYGKEDFANPFFIAYAPGVDLKPAS